MKSGILIHPEELSKKWIDRLVLHGVNTLGIHPAGGLNAANTLKELLSLLEKDEFRTLIDYAKSKGLTVEYEFHAAGYLLDRELFDTHPEYFRMNESGERIADLNFCTSDRSALKIVARNAVKLTSLLYGCDDTYFFWLDDAVNGRCFCPKCRSLSASDQQLMVLNEMITAIRKQRPGAKLAYLAYFDTLDTPKTISPADGIFLEYAPIDKWRRSKDEIEKYRENVRRELESRMPLLNFFGAKNSRVLEYWIDNSLFSGWKKPPKQLTCDGAEAKRDIEEYVKLGFEDISCFGCFLGADYECLYGEPDISPLCDAFNLYK